MTALDNWLTQESNDSAGCFANALCFLHHKDELSVYCDIDLNWITLSLLFSYCQSSVTDCITIYDFDHLEAEFQQLLPS
jgi:hypothetical protein